MDTFDGSQPTLVSRKTLMDIEDRLNVPFENDNRVINGLGAFYSEYVQPNMFPIIVVSILCIYLLIKYILKQDREEREAAGDVGYGEHNGRNERKDRKRRESKHDHAGQNPQNVGHAEQDGHSPQHESNHNDPEREERVRQIYKSMTGHEPHVVTDRGTSKYVSREGNHITESGNDDNDNDTDIADYISDDYLLTETDEPSAQENHEEMDPNLGVPIDHAEPIGQGMEIDNSMYPTGQLGLDEASRIIFGK